MIKNLSSKDFENQIQIRWIIFIFIDMIVGGRWIDVAAANQAIANTNSKQLSWTRFVSEARDLYKYASYSMSHTVRVDWISEFFRTQSRNFSRVFERELSSFNLYCQYVIGKFPEHELDCIAGKLIHQKFMGTFSVGHRLISGKLVQNRAFSWRIKFYTKLPGLK